MAETKTKQKTKALVDDVNAFIEGLAKNLTKKGKANVDIKQEANNNAEMAENFLHLAAQQAGVSIDVKSSKVSAIGIVKDSSDEEE